MSDEKADLSQGGPPRWRAPNTLHTSLSLSHRSLALSKGGGVGVCKAEVRSRKMAYTWSDDCMCQES